MKYYGEIPTGPFNEGVDIQWGYTRFSTNISFGSVLASKREWKQMKECWLFEQSPSDVFARQFFRLVSRRCMYRITDRAPAHTAFQYNCQGPSNHFCTLRICVALENQKRAYL